MTSVPYPSFQKKLPVVDDRSSCCTDSGSSGSGGGGGGGGGTGTGTCNGEDGQLSPTKSTSIPSTYLASVGRCRIDPMEFPSYYSAIYRSIVEKNIEQAHVKLLDNNSNNFNTSNNIDVDTINSVLAVTSTDEDKKKLEKKYMKQGVAMATKYLIDDLKLDVSIIDVEVVVQVEDIIDTDGCIAACFLDAGCDRIVIPYYTNSTSSSSSLDALECAKIPSDRIVVDFGTISNFNITSTSTTTTDATTNSNEKDISKSIQTEMEHVKPYCSCINVTVPICIRYEACDADMLVQKEDMISTLLALGNEEMQMIVQLSITTTTSTTISTYSNSGQDSNNNNIVLIHHHHNIAEMVGRCCTRNKESKNKLGIAFIDPTPDLLGRAYAACIKSDRVDGLYPTVVCTRSGVALGLVYSNVDSIIAALECGRGVYYSRSRNSLWRKGDTSGMYQTLHRIDVDCDGDAIRFTVTQRSGGCTNHDDNDDNNDNETITNRNTNTNGIGSFCHLNTLTCWGHGRGIDHLQETLQERLINAPIGSYTKRLFDDHELLRNKLVEEAQELAEATTKQHIAEELADLLYFAITRATINGVTMDDAVSQLDIRSKKVTRRPGNSKTFRITAGDQILEQTKQQQQAEAEAEK